MTTFLVLDDSDDSDDDSTTEQQDGEEAGGYRDFAEYQEDSALSEYELDWEQLMNHQQQQVAGRRLNYDDDDEGRNQEEVEAHFPGNLWTLKHLKSLKLKNYPFSTLPNRIGTLTKLEEFCLYVSRVTKLPSSISKLVNLETLDIMSTPLKAFPAGLKKLPKLQRISICAHPFPNLPKGLFSLTSITRLDICICEHLLKIPKEIAKLQGLVYLHIGDCENLNFIPPEIAQLKNLRNMSISNLGAVSAEFLSSMTQLDVLRIGMGTPAVPNGLQQLRNLKALSLECKSLEVMPSFLDQFPRLEALEVMSFHNEFDMPFCPQIKELMFRYCNDNSILNLAADARWRQGSRLEKLTLEGVALGENYIKILDWIPSSVNELRFSDCGIGDFNGFVDHRLPQGIQCLECTDIGDWRHDDRLCLSNAAEVLLERHDELTNINENCFKRASNLAKYWLFFNICGRKLLRRAGTNPLPLSIWPLVFENIAYSSSCDRIWKLFGSKKACKEIEASVMYEMLQGPAFLDRAHMPSRHKGKRPTPKRYNKKSSKKPRSHKK